MKKEEIEKEKTYKITAEGKIALTSYCDGDENGGIYIIRSL